MINSIRDFVKRARPRPDENLQTKSQDETKTRYCFIVLMVKVKRKISFIIKCTLSKVFYKPGKHNAVYDVIKMIILIKGTFCYSKFMNLNHDCFKLMLKFEFKSYMFLP